MRDTERHTEAQGPTEKVKLSLKGVEIGKEKER